MLKCQLLKNHAGILLLGDYESLRELHRIIHDVNERSPLVKNKESWFLGLAYDIRKAYERQREVIEPPEHYPEIGPRFGVEILWPVILYQARVLRESLAFIDHGKPHQVAAYTLEAIIEAALAEEFPKERHALVAAWSRMDPKSPGVEPRLDSRGAAFSAWSKTERRKHLAELLESFGFTYDMLKKTPAGAQMGSLPAGYFDEWEGVEWADPKW